MHNAIFNSAVLAACGALCIVGAFAFVIYGSFTKHWHAVKAKVVKRELTAIVVDDRSLKYELRRRESVYIKNIFYEYSIDNKNFRGRSIYVFGFNPFGGNKTKKFLAEKGGYQEGEEIQIYVDQHHPNRAVIVNGIPFGMVITSLLIGGVSVTFLMLPTALLTEHVDAAISGLFIGFILGCVLFFTLFIKSRSIRRGE